MELNTHLNQDRFSWISRSLTASDRASMLVEVTAPRLPRGVSPAQQFLSVCLTVTASNGVNNLRLLGDHNARSIAGGVEIELGTFTPGQTGIVVVQFDPKTAPKPGRRKVATLHLTYVRADDHREHSLSQTVWAQVAGANDRPPKVDRNVLAEVVSQRVQRHKSRANDAERVGDTEAARQLYQSALSCIERDWALIPRTRHAEFEREITLIQDSLARFDNHLAKKNAS